MLQPSRKHTASAAAPTQHRDNAKKPSNPSLRVALMVPTDRDQTLAVAGRVASVVDRHFREGAPARLLSRSKSFATRRAAARHRGKSSPGGVVEGTAARLRGALAMRRTEPRCRLAARPAPATIAWPALATAAGCAYSVSLIGPAPLCFFSAIASSARLPPISPGRSPAPTSALAVQVLKALETQLKPLLQEPAGEAAPMPISEAPPAVTGLRKSGESGAD